MATPEESRDSHDALFAQLLSMGFEPEMIGECQMAMAQSSAPFNVQAATEWLLRRTQQGRQAGSSSAGTLHLTSPPSSGTLHLAPPPSSSSSSSKPDVYKAISSAQQLGTPAEPLRSRYILNEEHARDKERFAAKERDEFVKRAREQRMAEIKARQQIKQQIAADRKAMQARSKKTAPQDESPVKEGGGSDGGGRREVMERKEGDKSQPEFCRMQVRLPSGKVLRHTFPSSTSLQDVAAFVVSSAPKTTSVQFVQPFPHHEFTTEELGMSLHSLGLCPSASLVVSKQTAEKKPKTEDQQSSSHGPASTQHLGQVLGGQAEDQQSSSHGPFGPASTQHLGQVLGGHQSHHSSGHQPPPGFHYHDTHASEGHRLHHHNMHVSSSQGHVLGRGDPNQLGRPPVSGHASELQAKEDRHAEPILDPALGEVGARGAGMEEQDQEEEPMEIVEEEADSDHSDSEEDDADPAPQPMFPPPQFGPGNFNLPLGFGGRRPPRHVHFAGGQAAPWGDQMFEGEGHRLGGKETSMVFGDTQRQKVQKAAREAAMKRALVTTPPVERVPHLHSSLPSLSLPPVPHLHSSLPSLEALCMRTLVSLTWSYGLPSCAHLTPRTAQRLIAALMEDKRLNPKTLAAFHGCHLKSIRLDNYAYATNELLGGLWYFPSLTEMSLGSCTIITDKALISLFPYLSGLTSLNLSGCRQLTEGICRSIRCCKSLEVLRLAQLKVSDRGVKHLLFQPLEQLRELDLSHTLISTRSLELLPQGTPRLEILSIESTNVDSFAPLCQLQQLHSLSVAHCPAPRAVGTLEGCLNLRSLNLTGMMVECPDLQLLAGLNLRSLKLPDRNLFLDESMEVVAGFPLSSLSLMDYCYVTDTGIFHLTSMHTLTELSLSRTKLTDSGMVFIAGLVGLRQLSLDNTIVTDEGVGHIAGLIALEVLSLSDTRVTSQFILNGVLGRLNRLSRFNLSRTAVSNRGILQLRLPSLVMLNLDWTCVSEACTLDYLREHGCPLLEIFRNRNIEQPLPTWAGGEEASGSDEQQP